MSPMLALAAVVTLLTVAAACGAVWRVRQGRARRVHEAGAVDLTAIDPAAAGSLGERATLVQFSTELCARCPQVRRKLAALAADGDGIRHLDVDLTHRPDLAARFHVHQTPTILVLDDRGVIRSRIGGVPAPGVVERELSLVSPEAAHV